MNIKRITSAILGLPIIAILLILGNKYVVDVFCFIIAIVCLKEYFECFKKTSKPMEYIAYFCALPIAFIHIIPLEYLKLIITLGIPIIILALMLKVIYTNMEKSVNEVFITFFGICYIVVLISFIAILRGLENGRLLVWYILIPAWGTDIFAYIIGKIFGKHKFSNISPNKTIEGCIGGIIGAIILGLGYTIIVNTYFGQEISYIYILVTSILLSIIGQLGDLTASAIKRYTNVKDFGNLIPGHGGMLDRIDSVIIIAPFAYVLFSII